MAKFRSLILSAESADGSEKAASTDNWFTSLFAVD